MKSIIDEELVDEELNSVEYVVFELASDKIVDKISIVCPPSVTLECSGITILLLKSSTLVMTGAKPGDNDKGWNVEQAHPKVHGYRVGSCNDTNTAFVHGQDYICG